MNRFLRLIIICTIGALAIHQALCYATTKTENGITVNFDKGYDFWEHKVAEMVFYDSYNPGTTSQVFNGAGGTATTSGSVNVRKYAESKVLYVQIPTLGGTGISVRVFGQVATETNWFELATNTYTATGNYHFNIGTPTDKLRVGVFETGVGDGTDAITITGTLRGIKRHK